jgi:hypothetical protein
VVFALPSPRGGLIDNNEVAGVDEYLNLDLIKFCQTILDGVTRWYSANEHDPNVVRNFPDLIRFRENGLWPIIDGVPVIA